MAAHGPGSAISSMPSVGARPTVAQSPKHIISWDVHLLHPPEARAARGSSHLQLAIQRFAAQRRRPGRRHHSLAGESVLRRLSRRGLERAFPELDGKVAVESIGRVHCQLRRILGRPELCGVEMGAAQQLLGKVDGRRKVVAGDHGPCGCGAALRFQLRPRQDVRGDGGVSKHPGTPRECIPDTTVGRCLSASIKISELSYPHIFTCAFFLPRIYFLELTP